MKLPRSMFALLVLAACGGRVMGDGGDDDDPGDEVVGDDDGQDEDDGPGGSGGGGDGGSSGRGGGPVVVAPAPMPFRRLTRLEYDNTVRDLLGDASRPAAAFPADDVGALGFATAINTSELVVTTALETAEKLAATAVSKLETLVPCAAAGDEACATTFISGFGRRAFRRPLLEAEKASLLALYKSARGELAYDFRGAIRVLLTAMLQAPQFLYHWELGPQVPTVDRDEIVLGPYELASRLSYFVWGSMPDDALFAAAEGGRLRTEAGLATEARRLLAEARSKGMVSDFLGQLLQLKDVLKSEKDKTAFPMWTPETRASAWAETERFLASVVLDGDSSWRTLLTSRQSFVDGRLAPIYGVEPRGVSLEAATLPSGQRAGLLTSASFLASHAGPTDGALITPIKRGKYIRTRLLCQDIPPPLANVNSHAAQGTTTRQRLSSHVTDEECRACHELMDDLGFAFEHYDAIGRWRTTDNGAPVDASGRISQIEGEPRFDDAVGLAERLVEAPEAEACALRNLVRYATGREEVEGEVATLQAALDGTLEVKEAMVAIVTSPGFTRRAPSRGEVLP